MSAAKHTPGPWIAGDDDDSDYYLVGPHDGDGIVFHPVVKLHNEADARLIAAAPELLEACKTFCEWLDREERGFDLKTHNRETPEGEAAWREWFYGNIDLCNEAQNQARAAIAKVTGAA